MTASRITIFRGNEDDDDKKRRKSGKATIAIIIAVGALLVCEIIFSVVLALALTVATSSC